MLYTLKKTLKIPLHMVEEGSYKIEGVRVWTAMALQRAKDYKSIMMRGNMLQEISVM